MDEEHILIGTGNLYVEYWKERLHQNELNVKKWDFFYENIYISYILSSNIRLLYRKIKLSVKKLKEYTFIRTALKSKI